MALLDIFRRRTDNVGISGRKTAEGVNRPQRMFYTLFGRSVAGRKYSDAYVWLVFNKIFNGLANVRFYNAEERSEFSDLCEFCEDNMPALWWQHVHSGFMVIARREGRYYIPDADKVRMDIDKQVLEPQGEEWCIHYSNPFALLGLSDAQILRENINNIDTYKNADDYLCRTYGALGIISGKDIPLNLNDRDDVLNAIKESKGITSDRQQFIISNNPIDFAQLSLPVDKLRLTDKVNEELKLIADYFGVPFDMLAASGKSTYANQEQANKNFYGNCIAPFAEAVLTIIKSFVRRSQLLVDSAEWTFTIDNVDGLSDERDRSIDRLAKLADVYQKITDIEGSERLAEIIKETTEKL